ncbi:unnamed protein product [Urochloa humidicola]
MGSAPATWRRRRGGGGVRTRAREGLGVGLGRWPMPREIRLPAIDPRRSTSGPSLLRWIDRCSSSPPPSSPRRAPPLASKLRRITVGSPTPAVEQRPSPTPTARVWKKRMDRSLQLEVAARTRGAGSRARGGRRVVAGQRKGWPAVGSREHIGVGGAHRGAGAGVGGAHGGAGSTPA